MVYYSWLIYGLQVEVVAIFIMIYGLLVLFKATSELQDEFRTALFYILASLSLNVIQGVTVGILLVKGVSHEHAFWLIFPFFGLFASFLLVLGAKKFFSSVKEG